MDLLDSSDRRDGDTMDDGGMNGERNWDDNVKEERVELFEFAIEAKAKVTVFPYSARMVA